MSLCLLTICVRPRPRPSSHLQQDSDLSLVVLELEVLLTNLLHLVLRLWLKSITELALEMRALQWRYSFTGHGLQTTTELPQGYHWHCPVLSQVTPACSQSHEPTAKTEIISWENLNFLLDFNLVCCPTLISRRVHSTVSSQSVRWNDHYSARPGLAGSNIGF